MEVHVLIRGDLFSMQHDDIFSEITDRSYRFLKCPGTNDGSICPFVRYETKMSRLEMMLCSVNLYAGSTNFL